MAIDAPTVPGGLVAMLDMLAEMIVQSLGFGVAVFNIALPDGSLEVVSVAGNDDARAALMGNIEDGDTWDRALEVSEHWGRLRFAEHTKAEYFVEDLSWVPEFEPLDGEDAWHPEDELFAPLTAADGTRLGILSVDLPRGLRRPDAATRSALEAFVVSAALAIENRALSEELNEAQKIGRIGSIRVELGTGASAWSEELYRLLGCDLDSSSWLFAEFRGRVHPGDVAALDEVLGSDESGTFDIEFRIQRADGRLVWLRMLGETQRSAGNETARMIATLQEITESKAQELRLREALSQGALIRAFISAANESDTLEAALALSADHLREWDAGCDLASFVVEGLPDADDLVLHPMSGVSSTAEQDCGPAAARLARRAARERRLVIENLGGTSETVVAYPVFSQKDMVAVCVLSTAIVLSYSSWVAVAVAAAEQAVQVLERERTHAALADARDAAMSASRQKSEFLATMSHEVRTPINGVLGLNDLLLRTPLEPNQVRLAEGVRVAGKSLLDVINDILDFSKIEAGMLDLEHADFEVGAVTDRAAALLGGQAAAQGVELVVDVAPEVPRFVRGDPTRVSQVLTNLISNAVKFTSDGEVVVRCDLDRTPAATSPKDLANAPEVVLRWEVRDTGIGIAHDHLGRLFEPFSQAESSTTREYGGSGLGLAICQRLVSAMGGELGARSEAGRGSTFWFRLPLEAADVQADRSVPEPDLSGRRVLVADDNPNVRQALQHVLTGWGIEVETASNEDEALGLCRSCGPGSSFDAALLGAAIGDGQGASVLDGCDFPPRMTILLSSELSVDDGWAANAGIDAVLTKPVGRAVLRNLLSGAWTGRAADATPGSLELVPEDNVSGERVLLVEDNEINQMVAAGVLDHLGYDVEVAPDGAVAVAKADAERFDIILMDIQMPRMDGYSATRRIRAGHGPSADAFIVAMTAAAVSGERARCLAAGMDEFLAKPFDLHSLADILRSDRTGEQVPSAQIIDGGRPPDRTSVDGTAADTADAPELRRSEDAGTLQLVDRSRMEELLEMGPGAETLVQRAVQRFIDLAHQTVAELRRAAQADDRAQIRAQAHALRGSASNVGAVALSVACQHLEELAATHLPVCDSSAAATCAEKVEELLGPTLDALREQLDQLMPDTEAAPQTTPGSTIGS